MEVMARRMSTVDLGNGRIAHSQFTVISPPRIEFVSITLTTIDLADFIASDGMLCCWLFTSWVLERALRTFEC